MLSRKMCHLISQDLLSFKLIENEKIKDLGYENMYFVNFKDYFHKKIYQASNDTNSEK